YWQEWQDPRLVVAVLHNDDLNQVTWEMRAMGGAPKFPDSQSLPDVDYAGFAASLGLAAHTVTDPESLGDVWEQALSADRPTVLVEVTCGDVVGTGWTYGPAACAAVVRDELADVVVGRPVDAVPGTWSAMVASVRNATRAGLAGYAVSAVDVALWDLKARRLGV